MAFLVFLSFVVPGLALFFSRKEFANQAALGFAAGEAPLLASAAWSLYFIVRYRNVYGFNEMELMNGFKMMNYVVVAIAVPLFANLIWRRSEKRSLFRERLALFFGFIAACVLVENTPVTWSFTFVLFPFSIVILVVGFLFLKRPVEGL